MCVVTSAGICNAQQANRALTPSEIVDHFLKAQQAEQWSEAASYLDPEALERIRQREISQYSDANFPHWTVEQFMKNDPEMPREVAEYELKRMNKLRKSRAMQIPWSYEFADANTVEELRKFTRDELGVSWVKAHDLAYRSRQSVAACEQIRSESAAAIAKRVASMRTYRILGEIVNDSMAYVLKEDGFEGKPSNPLEDVGIILPPENFMLRKVAATWKLLPFIGRSSNVISIACMEEQAPPPKKK